MGRLLTLGLAACAALAGGAALPAEVVTEGTSSPGESPRALNGHVFQPTRLVPGPFAATSFGTTTLLGAGEAEAPRYNLRGDQIGTRNYPMAAYGQSLELELRVVRDVGLRVQANGLLFTGTNSRALLSAGGSARPGFLVGLVAGMNLRERFRLAAVIDAGVQPELSLTIAAAVARAVREGTFRDAGLASGVDRARAAPGVSFAWAPVPALGLVAEARYVWTKRISGEDETSDTSQGVTVGGALEVDLDPVARWPIALQVAYAGEYGVGSDGIPRTDQLGIGLWYTRRVRLALGLELTWRKGELRPGVEPKLDSNLGLAAIRFRYYW